MKRTDFDGMVEALRKSGYRFTRKVRDKSGNTIGAEPIDSESAVVHIIRVMGWGVIRISDTPNYSDKDIIPFPKPHDE